jgi:hypothetical protein
MVILPDSPVLLNANKPIEDIRSIRNPAAEASEFTPDVAELEAERELLREINPNGD